MLEGAVFVAFYDAVHGVSGTAVLEALVVEGAVVAGLLEILGGPRQQRPLFVGQVEESIWNRCPKTRILIL